MLDIDGQTLEITLPDVEITTQDIPGWLIATMDNLTVALDVTITQELKEEGLARDLVNRIQNLRKDKDFEVTDKVRLKVETNGELGVAIQNNYSYICSETLAESLDVVDQIDNNNKVEIELSDGIRTHVSIKRI